MPQNPSAPAGLDRPSGIRTIPFAAMTSACTTPGFAVADRRDPYWLGMWTNGSQASWMSKSMLNRLAAAKLTRLSRGEAKSTTASALTQMLRTRRQAHLKELAAIGMFRTVNGGQLAAITGHPAAAVNPTEMSWAFRGGLIDRGSMLTDLEAGPVKNENYLYRPVDTPNFKDLAAQLTYEEWLAVTAGQPWTRAAQNDRHNILATELALRIAELCDVGTVLGERLARHKMLAQDDTSAGGPVADLAVIREDGQRIAIEITASGSPSFSAKIQRWAKTLAEVEARRIGLSVLFIEAGGPDRPDHVSTTLWKSMRHQVATAAYENAGARSGVPERMAIARWRWYFPEPGCASSAFQVLECLRPTGPWNDRWQVAALLDPTDLIFDPKDPNAATALIRNSWDLAGLPQWLKPAGHRTNLGAALMRRAGISQIPTIAPLPR